MSMINCPECQNEISESAMKCPKCGVQLRKAKRGFFGTVFKWLFILFNVLMVWWMVEGIGITSDAVTTAGSGAEQTGAAIGSGLGMMMIFGIWVVGDIILGLFVLFTKPSSS